MEMPFRISWALSAGPRRAITLTLYPFSESVKASFRTLVSAGKALSTSIRTLPAYSFIVPVQVGSARQRFYQVSDYFAVSQCSERLFKLERALCDDDNLGPFQGVLDGILHKTR